MKIIFTAYAKSQVKEIYQYYKNKASLKVALKIKLQILNKIKILKTYKKSGSEEQYLKHLQLEHRKLITGNYKIIYRIEEETIFITDVFDTRQNPEKLHP